MNYVKIRSITPLAVVKYSTMNIQGGENLESIQQLKQQLEDWEDMQGIDDEEDEQEWIQAGISLYEKCIEVDRTNKSEYLQSLSHLYLNFGRNEK